MTFKSVYLIFTVERKDIILQSNYFKKKIETEENIDTISIEKIDYSLIFELGKTYRIAKYNTKILKEDFCEDFNIGNSVYSLFEQRLDGIREKFLDDIKRAKDEHLDLIDEILQFLRKENLPYFLI